MGLLDWRPKKVVFIFQTGMAPSNEHKHLSENLPSRENKQRRVIFDAVSIYVEGFFEEVSFEFD